MLNPQKRKWIINQLEKGVLKIADIAHSQKVSRQTIYDLKRDYQFRGLSAFDDKPRGRKVDEIPLDIQTAILEKRKEGYGIRTIEGLLKLENVFVSHNKIHKFLAGRGMITPEPKKRKRKHYIRWERNHSNSLWQTDFCWIPQLDCWLCGWLDDHSRFVPVAEYLTEATTDEVIRLFEKGAKTYGYPRETLSDRETQFYANLGEKCRFLQHMDWRKVKHIYASLKKPTTCGKLERFWGTHNKERWDFPTLGGFLEHYNHNNHKRPHMSLNYLTPYQVYKRDLKV